MFSQTFAPPVTVFYNEDVNILTSIKSADIDDDGTLDLVLSTADINSFWIKGSGNSDFGDANVIFNDEIFGEAVATLDADNDGDIDVITAASFSNDVLYSENLGDGEFATAVILVEDQFPIETMILLDVDNDGEQDVLVSGRSATDKMGEVFLLRNNGDGSFGSKETIVSNIQDVRTITYGDLDDDGNEDLVIGTYWDSKLFWAENDGNGDFSTVHDILLEEDAIRTFATTAEDLDKDGDIDIIHSTTNAMTIMYPNDGTGEFGDGIMLNDISSWYITSADIDSDGDKDLIQGKGTDKNLLVFLNDGNGGFGDGSVLATELGVVNNLEIVDWDGDGDLDMFTSSSLFDEFLYFENLVDIPVSVSSQIESKTSIFPNPSSGVFTVFSDDDNSKFFKMTNILGGVVNKMSRLPENGIELESQVKGTFIIQIFDGDYKLLESRKVVIQ